MYKTALNVHFILALIMVLSKQKLSTNTSEAFLRRLPERGLGESNKKASEKIEGLPDRTFLIRVMYGIALNCLIMYLCSHILYVNI